jgi:hypothetical protein
VKAILFIRWLQPTAMNAHQFDIYKAYKFIAVPFMGADSQQTRKALA